MSRSPDIIRPVSLEVHLPEDLRARLDLELFSPVEGRVPKGAYRKFISQLLLDYFAKKESSNVSQI